MLSDLRHALRLFMRCRGFAALAIALLALGIGSTTAVYSIVDAAVIRPLPYDKPDQLVVFSFTPGSQTAAPPRAFLDWRERQQAFESIGGVAGIALSSVDGGETQTLRASRVTADFFSTYRVRPLIGSLFGYDAEHPGRDKVAVISYRFWERRYGRAGDVVGKSLLTDRGSYQIVGVLPDSFQYPAGLSWRTDVFVPIAFAAEDRQHGVLQSSFVSVIGRLAAGVRVDQASAHINTVNEQTDDRRLGFNKGRRIALTSMHEQLTGRARAWMLMLLGSVSFVLLISCINVASLFLAHGVDRVRELTVRSALGASPARIARQMFAESLLIAVCGACCGLALAWWGVEVLRASIPATVPRASTIGMDLRVLAFTAALSMATAFVCGVIPALSSRRADPVEGLKEGGRSSTAGRGRQRLGQLLALAEVAGAVVLVIGAILFIRSFVRATTIDPGFDTSRMYAMELATPSGIDRTARAPFAADVVARIRTVPGIADAAVGAGARPFGGSLISTPFTIDGDETRTKHAGVIIRSVTPEYLPLVGVPIRSGRTIDSRDTASAPDVVVLNESAARLVFGSANPLGRRLRFGDYAPEIVGVAADVRSMGREVKPEPELYLPLAQERIKNVSAGFSLVVRVEGDATMAIAGVRKQLLGLLPGRQVTTLVSIDETARRAAAPRRFNMLLLTIFGILALGIAATGIYGLMAYTVRRRTHEIGVRLALGARPADVTALVLRQSATVIAVGLALGLGAAWLLARTIESFLFEMQSRDPVDFGAGALVIAVAGLLACWLPVRRAARVDPVVALRAE